VQQAAPVVKKAKRDTLCLRDETEHACKVRAAKTRDEMAMRGVAVVYSGYPISIGTAGQFRRAADVGGLVEVVWARMQFT
jgi:hypothetical protein